MDASVVIPTYREAENLPLIVPRIAAALHETGWQWEILIVDDDSPDGTPSVCAALSERLPLRLAIRRSERGLASAVLHGIGLISGSVAVILDADLSHPPEKIPELVRPVLSGECDITVGSRYVQGGGAEAKWGWYRRLNSRVATLLARPLTPVRDCLAGFFALRPALIKDSPPLNPVGFKILLEILVKTAARRVREVPITFADRHVGQSKLNSREQVRYLWHLMQLYRFAGRRRFQLRRPRLRLPSFF